MAELTTRQRRKGLEFAEEIAALAVRAPDSATKSEIYRVVNSVRGRYGYKESEKESEILRVVHLGASSVTDIIRETGMTQQDISRITTRLAERNLIRLQPLERSGGGRPQVLFFPVEAVS